MRMPKIIAAGAACALLALAGTAAAQPATPAPQSPEAIQKVYACSAVADATERLACFDAAVGALKTAETQGQFTAIDAAGVKRIEREAFGFNMLTLPRMGLPSLGRSGEEEASRIAMKIARASRYDGKPAFVMDNGQTWVVLDIEENRHARAGAPVTVRRAAMGSYLMSVDAGGKALRVRRVE